MRGGSSAVHGATQYDTCSFTRVRLGCVIRHHAHDTACVHLHVLILAACAPSSASHGTSTRRPRVNVATTATVKKVSRIGRRLLTTCAAEALPKQTREAESRFGWSIEKASARIRWDRVQEIPLSKIRRPFEYTRKNNEEKVEALMQSIEAIGPMFARGLMIVNAAAFRCSLHVWSLVHVFAVGGEVVYYHSLHITKNYLIISRIEGAHRRPRSRRSNIRILWLPSIRSQQKTGQNHHSLCSPQSIQGDAQDAYDVINVR